MCYSISVFNLLHFNISRRRLKGKDTLSDNATLSNWIYLSSEKKSTQKGKNFLLFSRQGPVVQSIVSLTSFLITNSLAVVGKVFSDTLIILLQKCE